MNTAVNKQGGKMIKLSTLVNTYEDFFARVDVMSGLAPLIFRLIVAPVMIVAGYQKLGLSDPDITGVIGNLTAAPSIVAWFGNTEWGLGLPFPELMGFLAAWSEFLGGWLILFGLATRFAALPLMFTMIVAATTVHWHNGWFAIAPSNADASAAQVFAWLGSDTAKASLVNSGEVAERLSAMKRLIDTHGYPEWLYEKGPIAVLNNGIEFAAIYFAMLLSLFFSGGGRWTSIDFYLQRYLR